jgi:hypothetical protein
MTNILNSCYENNIVPVFGSCLMHGSPAAIKIERQDSMNTWMSQNSIWGDLNTYIDLEAELMEGDSLKPSYDSGDGVHPTDAGYRIIGDSLNWAINNILISSGIYRNIYVDDVSGINGNNGNYSTQPLKNLTGLESEKVGQNSFVYFRTNQTFTDFTAQTSGQLNYPITFSSYDSSSATYGCSAIGSNPIFTSFDVNNKNYITISGSLNIGSILNAGTGFANLSCPGGMPWHPWISSKWLNWELW